MSYDPPAHHVGYEIDGDDVTGDVCAFYIAGHAHGPDDVELFLDWWADDDEAFSGCWEVTETWLRRVPFRGGSRYVTGGPGRGATPVTMLAQPSAWGYWCINHPYEPAVCGHPASSVVGGEEIVALRSRAVAQDLDPRPDVSHPGSVHSLIYMCRECSTSFSERLAQARAQAVRDLPTQKGA